MGFAERFLKSLTDLFLGLHWIAVFYAVMEPMILIYGFWVYYVVGFLLIPLFFAPAGPLSLTLFDLYGLMAPAYLVAPEAHLLLVLGVAVGIVILKFFIYSAVRRNRVLGVSAARLLFAYTAAVLLILISIMLGLLLPYLPYSLRTLSGMIRLLTTFLVYTVPMDLTIFSYVKFRDAVRGAEPRLWIPVLAALWTAVPSLTFVVIILRWVGLPDFWNPFTITFISARTAITALQLTYIALYIRSGGAAVQKQEKSVYAAQTAASGG